MRFSLRTLLILLLLAGPLGMLSYRAYRRWNPELRKADLLQELISKTGGPIEVVGDNVVRSGPPEATTRLAEILQELDELNWSPPPSPVPATPAAIDAEPQEGVLRQFQDLERGRLGNRSPRPDRAAD